MRYFPFILLLITIFIGCDEYGNPITNNYYNGDTTIVNDTTIIVVDTTIINDTTIIVVEDTTWGHDSKIGGTSISDTTYINWEIVTILDEQKTVCSSSGSEDDWSCRGYLISQAGMDKRFQFHRDGSFTFEKLENDNDEGYNSLGTESGTWQTMNGLLELNLTNSTAMNSTANYFFHNRTYNYETNVGSGELRIYDSQTEINFEVVYEWDE